MSKRPYCHNGICSLGPGVTGLYVTPKVPYYYTVAVALFGWQLSRLEVPGESINTYRSEVKLSTEL